MRFRSLPGFRDFYPEDMARRRWIEQAWHQASREAGFEEVDGPVLEALELFTAKSGDQIVEQLYCFEDKGGRAVSLRPEMTPTIARMVAGRAGGLPKPIKWYCVPQFFRYEKPQRGRGREFVQWNADILGSASPAADAEAIAVALRALERLGLGPRDLVVRVNDRRVVERLLRELDVPEDADAAVLACIDRLERDDAARERLAELAGPSAADEIGAFCREYPLARAEELSPVLEACEEFGLGDYVEPAFAIVRGLAYYTGPVWEVFDRGLKLRSVAGGGRYDRLIESLGGPALDALGFGMGDMVLGELLAERGLVPDKPARIDALVIPIGTDMEGNARRVAARLRREGVRAEALYTAARVGKALRAADAAGATRAVLVGPDEWAQGQVKVKDLASGEERTVPRDALE